MSDPIEAQPPADQADASSAAGATPTPNTPSSPETTASQEAAAEAPSEAAEPKPAAEAAPADAAEPASDAGAGAEPAKAPAEGQQPAAAAGAEEGAKKKRRRRRRKKGAAADGAEGAQAEGEKAKEKKEPAGVFSHLFAGGPRKHAFAAGEVVAGRVTKVEAGVATVDLFGKAVAFMDVLEPRDVPVMPEPPKEEPASATEQAATEASASATEGAGEGAEASPETAPAGAEATAPEAQAAAAEPTTAEAAAPVAETPEAEAKASEATTPEAEASPADPAAEPSEAAAAAPESPEATTPEAAPSQPEEQAAADSTSAAEPPAAEGAVGEESTPAEGTEPAAAPASGAVAATKGEAKPKPEPVEITPEFSEPYPEAPTVGQIMRGRIGSVSESGHIVLVNRLIDRPAAKAQIRASRDAKQRVEGVVYGYNRGGFDVLVRGVRVFCPARSMSLSPITDPETQLGQKVEFTVSPNKGSGSSLVVGRRGILEREQRKQAKALLKSLEPGQKLTGKVTQVREFGVFVDIGGIEGLVHQSELSHSRGVRPADVAKPGDEVEVQVLKLGGGDGASRKDRERVSLSMRALQPDPWQEHEELLRPGSVHEAKVVRLTDFGAFMQLAPMVEGLLHISELGRDLKHANAVLSDGETVHVVIERVDRKQRRISLSKLSAAELEAVQAGKAPEAEAKLPKPGKRIQVNVDRVEHAGLVVRVPGIFGKRGRGFIPNSEVGTERGTDHRKMFAAGQELEVKVIGTDRDGGLRCSIKALTLDEEKRAVQDYRKEVAKQGLGTFGDLLREKLGAGKGS